MSNPSYKVVSGYTSAYPNPLILEAGQRVIVEDRETEWAGWVWCETEEGQNGWAPESYIERNKDKGIAKKNYNATELTVKVGDELEVIHEESGWVFARNFRNQTGWVPLRNLYTSNRRI